MRSRPGLRQPRALEDRGLPRIIREHPPAIPGIAHIAVRLSQRHHERYSTMLDAALKTGRLPTIGNPPSPGFQALDGEV